MALYKLDKDGIGFSNSEFEAVAFEGPDCCGKSTQVDLFIENVKKSYDVVFKFHFPFNSFGDNTLKDNYDALCKTIFSKDYLSPTPISEEKIDELETVLENNITKNHEDKMIFLNNINNLIKGIQSDDGNDAKAFRDMLYNKNCEVWFDGTKVEKNDLYINNLIDAFKNMELSVLMIFDRFIISGIIYNYFLPASIITDYVQYCNDSSPNPTIPSTEWSSKLYSILDTLRNEQESATEDEIITLNTIIGTPMLTAAEEASNERFCEPSMSWFVFKPSNAIYQMFLQDKNRKVEEYDSNAKIRMIVNTIYTDICMNRNSPYLMGNVFNISVIDTDALVDEFLSKSTKTKISTMIYNDWFIHTEKSHNLLHSTSHFLNDSYFRK